MQTTIDATSPHSGGATPIQIPSHEPMPELADVKLFQAMDRKAKLFFQSQSSKLDKLKGYAFKLAKQGIELKNIDELKTYDIPSEILANLSVEKVLLQSQSRFQRMAKTSKIKRNWSLGDLTILLWLIAAYSETQCVPLAEIHNDPNCWKFVNDLITCTTPQQCLFRWMGFKKYRVTEFAWSDQQDYLLKSLEKKYRDHPSKWKVLAQQLYKLNPSVDKIYRQAKQCKQHFNSFLDPTIKKGLWSKQEDLLLFSAYLKFACRRRWCLINKFFTNRTENSLKNRFQLLHNRLMNDAVQPSDEPIIIRKYVDGLRTQIRKLEMEDELVLKADELLRESIGSKMEEEDTPQRDVDIPSPSKITIPSKIVLQEQKVSQIIVKTQQVEEIVMHKTDILSIKGESFTNLSTSNCAMEQQPNHQSPFTSYAPVQFFDGQTIQTIAFPYFNGFYSLPFYQFSSATNLQSSAPAASEAVQQQA